MKRRLGDWLVNWLVDHPLGALRRRAYRKGKRPRPGSVLFSPSLDLRYAWQDAVNRGCPPES